ncbi:MAG: hypothetical protein ACOCX2_01335 [Armatimonadota bacterium]
MSIRVLLMAALRGRVSASSRTSAARSANAFCATRGGTSTYWTYILLEVFRLLEQLETISFAVKSTTRVSLKVDDLQQTIRAQRRPELYQALASGE